MSIVRRGFKYTQNIPKKTKDLDGLRLQYNGLIMIDEYVKKQGINGLMDVNVTSINQTTSIFELKFREGSRIIEASNEKGFIREISELEKQNMIGKVKLKEVRPLEDKQYINYNVDSENGKVQSDYQNVVSNNIERLSNMAYKISNNVLDKNPTLVKNFDKFYEVIPPKPMRKAPSVPTIGISRTSSMSSIASDDTLVNDEPSKASSKGQVPYVEEIRKLQRENSESSKKADFSKNYFSHKLGKSGVNKFFGGIKKHMERVSHVLSDSQETLNTEKVIKKPNNKLKSVHKEPKGKSITIPTKEV